MSNVAPDGHLVVEEMSEPLQPFEGTLFDAALDAANQKIWPKEFFLGSKESRFNTQLHQIGRAALLVGVAPGQEAEQREVVAEILDAPCQQLCEEAAQLGSLSTYQEFGDAISRVLQVIPKTVSLFEQFAAAGHEVGFWPPLHFWNPSSKKLYPSSFAKFKTRAPPARR